MHKVYLALGSNVGDSPALLKHAVEGFKPRLSHIKQASVYRTKAVGYTNQPDFYNTAVSGETDLSPKELLHFVKDLEKSLGRIERFHWGPREIDIDIIFYDDQMIESPKLSIPHPRFAERDFVLKPLADINPELVDPLSHKTISTLLAETAQTNQSVIEKIA